MSKLETNTIDTISGSTNLTLGGTNATDITIPSGVTITNNGTQSGFGGTNTPAFMASVTSDQTLSDNTLTKIAFSNEVIDTDNAYDPSTNYRFTPGVVGKYAIGANGWIFNSPDLIQTIQLFIYKNGSEISYSHTANYNATFERLQINFNTIIDVGSTSDYYEVYVRQNTSNGSTSTFSGSGNNAKFRNSFYSYKLIT